MNINFYDNSTFLEEFRSGFCVGQFVVENSDSGFRKNQQINFHDDTTIFVKIEPPFCMGHFLFGNFDTGFGFLHPKNPFK